MTYDEMVANIMTALAVTEEEAKNIIETNRLIDKEAMRQANRKKETALRQRERKADADKREIILSLNSFLVDFVHEYDENCIDDDVCMTNPEKQIDFTFRGKKYRIMLSAPRK